MNKTLTESSDGTGSRTAASTSTMRVYAPGIAVSFAAALLALFFSRLVPLASPALTTVVLGILAANLGLIPAVLRPGLAIASKQVLRIGIVLLGFQLALGDIVALGPGVLGVIVAVVAIGVGAGVLAGRLLRIPTAQTLLISCGFSICGAAAVAAASGALDPGNDEEQREELEAQTAVAIALVVVFGTLMIAAIPALAAFLGFDGFSAGLLAGASIHEVAQVVAAGSIIGGSALAVAVLVKLGRVVLLAPMIAVITAVRRSEASPERAKPPLVPVFVLGFLAAIVVRTIGIVPMPIIDAIAPVQVVFLAAAMFALGTGARLALIKQVGLRPIILAAFTTCVVLAVSLVGVHFVG